MPNTDNEHITWESANDFIERQTKVIEANYHRSHPLPRYQVTGLQWNDPWPQTKHGNKVHRKPKPEAKTPTPAPTSQGSD